MIIVSLCRKANLCCKVSALLMMLFLSSSLLSGQSNSQRAVFQFQANFGISKVFEIPLKEIIPFLAYSLVWRHDNSKHIAIRFSKDGHNWTIWTRIDKEQHDASKPGRQVSKLYFTEADYQFFQIKLERPSEEISCHFFSPGKTTSGLHPTSSHSKIDICTQPAYIPRGDWCSLTVCPTNTQPASTQVSHLIIHHSAGTNVANDWAAVVRAIWDLHVNTNGWSDIGYNWLIDPNGVIYEGRGDDILGAHFCATNSKTMGVCMLGNFTNTTPKLAALNSLVDLLAWKASEREIDPQGESFHPSSGLNLPQISGHREGCATQCPGNSFYPMIPDIRQEVSNFINTSCGTVTATSNSIFSSTALYPNPVREMITIDLKTPKAINLTIIEAATGGIVQTYEQERQGFNKQSITLPVNNLKSGVYYLLISDNVNQKIINFVKLP